MSTIPCQIVVAEVRDDHGQVVACVYSEGYMAELQAMEVQRDKAAQLVRKWEETAQTIDRCAEGEAATFRQFARELREAFNIPAE